VRQIKPAQLAFSERYKIVILMLVSSVAECPPQWTVLVDKNSLFGIRYDQYRTVPSCQAYCASVPSCVAIDFNFLDTSCWLHISASDLDPDNVYDQENTNQYRIDRECASTTSSSTTTPTPTTTGL